MNGNQKSLTFRELFQQYNQEEPEFIPLTNDLLFHKVFTENKEALACLLSSLLNLPREEIVTVDILNPVQYGESSDARQTILDLNVHLNQEKYILVEVQVRRYQSWTDRALVYASRHIADQVKGNSFDYGKLQQVVQISIMSHTLFPDHRKFFTKYTLRDETGYEFSDRLQFLTMDLTAADLATEAEKKQGLVEWAKAFGASTWEEVESVDTPGIQEVKSSMTFIMSQPTERDRIFAHQMAIWDQNTIIADAKREAEAAKREVEASKREVEASKREVEAITQKHENEKKEIARKMSGKGISPEEIADLLNLTVDSVQAWLSEKP